MYSGYYANHALTIEWDKVKELIPNETKQLEDILESIDSDITDFGRNY
jgi:hypothetical protein